MTGARINAETSLTVTTLMSGPLSGGAQIGAMIAEGRLDALIFSSIRSLHCRMTWT